MTSQQRLALLKKEWIKFRWTGILILGFILYAALDAFLTLKGIRRAYGSFGLMDFLITKQIPFFKLYGWLPAVGALVGFCQTRPEVKDKRLRILFHTPTQPESIVGTTMVFGTGVLLAANGLAHLLTTGIMAHFHLPAEIIIPVLQTLAGWSLMGLVCFFATAALCAAGSWSLRGLILICTWICNGIIVGDYGGYGLKALDLPLYLVLVAGFIPLAFYTFLNFMDGHGARPICRLCRGLSLILICLCFSSAMPRLYWRTFGPDSVKQSLNYSPVEKQFLIQRKFPESMTQSGTQKKFTYHLENGKELDRNQLYQALPITHSTALIKQGRFPEQVDGVRLSPARVRFSWQMTKLRPREWNRPAPMLYKLLEADAPSGRLENPRDFFRLSDNGIEFLDPRTGRVKKEKTAVFNRALEKSGFLFPVQALAGNPNIRKPYDEGYLMVDTQHRLFLMKMSQGHPVCVNTGQELVGKVQGLFINEHGRREILGSVITDQGAWLLMQKSLTLTPLPINDFDPRATEITFRADPLGKLIKIRNVQDTQAPTRAKAMDKGFNITREYSLPPHPRNLESFTRLKTAASLFFPFRLTTRDPATAYSRLHLKAAANIPVALAGNGLWLFALLGLLKWGKIRIRPWDLLITGVFGFVGLVGVLTLEYHRPLSLTLIQKKPLAA